MRVFTVWQQASREVHVLADSGEEARQIAESRDLYYDGEWDVWNEGVVGTILGDLDEYDLIWNESDQSWVSAVDELDEVLGGSSSSP